MEREPSHPLLRPIVVAPGLLALAAGVAWWFANRGLPNPDEGAVLTAAARILRGDVFYRELDAYWMPGSAYALAGAFADGPDVTAGLDALTGTPNESASNSPGPTNPGSKSKALPSGVRNQVATLPFSVRSSSWPLPKSILILGTGRTSCQTLVRLAGTSPSLPADSPPCGAVSVVTLRR